jgi:hypothetical protein
MTSILPSSLSRPACNARTILAAALLAARAFAFVAGNPPLAAAQTKPVSDPANPPSRSFHDSRARITLQVPAGWNLSVKDGEVSTFKLDARSAPRATQMRALASIAFNPYPESTFSGAFFYLSLNSRLPAADCVRQAATPAPRTTSTSQIGGVAFTHGYDEHGSVCTEARDEIYTATHNGVCYRFDLIINTFCGGDVSGVRDITPAQLEAVRHRLEAILSTVQFDK